MARFTRTEAVDRYVAGSTIAYAKKTFGARYVEILGPDDLAHSTEVVRKKMFALDAREAPSRHRPAPERKEAAYFENEELPRLFAELSDASSKTLCLVALKRGIRQGELFALRLGDVDLEQAVVGVRRSYTGGVVSTPKNRKRRDVDLISVVVELLSGWRQTRSMSFDGSLVFPGTDGRAFLAPTVLLRRQLYPAMTRAGIPRVGPTHEKRTFHSFRQTFAKRALETGAQTGRRVLSVMGPSVPYRSYQAVPDGLGRDRTCDLGIKSPAKITLFRSLSPGAAGTFLRLVLAVSE